MFGRKRDSGPAEDLADYDPYAEPLADDEELSPFTDPQTESSVSVPDSLVDWYLNPESPSPVKEAQVMMPPDFSEPQRADFDASFSDDEPPADLDGVMTQLDPSLSGLGSTAASPRAHVPGSALPVPLERPPMTEDMLRLKARAKDALIERLGSRLYDSSVSEDELGSQVIDELAEILSEEATQLSGTELEMLSESLINDILGHGAIEPFLKDESITEIMVNGLEAIFVERAGRLFETTTRFHTDEELRQVIDRIVSRIGRRVDESSPMVDARLPDGSRVNAIIPPLAVDGPSLTIRKFPTRSLDAFDLIEFGTLSGAAVALLKGFVVGRLNILVSGGTGSGKTTLLNVLSNFIPDGERIVTIEDSVELRLNKRHVVRLEARPANLEGKGAVHIRDLVRNALRMRPDRIVVGECRGGETLDMLQAMNTGHDGSLSTLHANTPRDAIARVETMVMMAGMDLPIAAIREQVSSAVDVIVQLDRMRDGTRKVTQITEVVGMEGDTVTLSDIFMFDFEGLDEHGSYVGELKPTGLRPMLLDKLADHGVELDASIFGAPTDVNADFDFSQY